jgi:7-cyano-7-deazaguanine synthase in queuosine biosynthesis
MSRKILTYSMYGEKTETPKIWEAKRYIVSSLSENEAGYDLTLVEYADDSSNRKTCASCNSTKKDKNSKIFS